MRLILRALMPILLIVLCSLGAKRLIDTKPEPRKRPAFSTPIRVVGQTLKVEPFSIPISTRGTVRPRIESTFVPEVGGRIVNVSPKFYEGQFFEEGDTLITIDPLNYETAVSVAQGNLAQATAALAEEEAKAAQAKTNWERLGKTGTPSDLVLRKPQLAQAKASLAASRSQLEKASRDLERTEIRAPYAGRILEKSVDIGQYVSPGTMLAKAFAVDVVEVRLPLTNEQLAFVDLPEQRRGAEPPAPGAFPTVTLRGKIAGRNATWQGRVVRIEGAIDSRTRQLFVTAQVDDPYAPTDDNQPPLKVGLYVEAEISGRALDNVMILPRAAVRADNEIILIDQKANTIHRHIIDPLWGDEQRVIVQVGKIKPGDVLCTTPISFPAEGAAVLATVDGIEPTETPRGGPNAGGGKGGKAGKGKGKQ